MYPVEVERVLYRPSRRRRGGGRGRRRDRALGEIGVAFVVPAATGGAPDPDDLRRFVREHLADYKVPDRVVVVDAMPLTPIGKIDRRGAHRLHRVRAGTREVMAVPAFAFAGELLDCDGHLYMEPDVMSEIVGGAGASWIIDYLRDYVDSDDDVAARQRGRSETWSVKGISALGVYDAADRVAALDTMGIHRQLLFPNTVLRELRTRTPTPRSTPAAGTTTTSSTGRPGPTTAPVPSARST